jgi:hypothetical protein
MKILRMTKAAAMQKSHEYAVEKGCGGITQYWWDFCDDGLLLGEDLTGLSEEEIAAVTEYSFPEE